LTSQGAALDALKFILCEKIYPMRPDLIRNDSQTALIVMKYVVEIAQTYYGRNRTNRRSWSTLQEESAFLYDQILPLEELRMTTVRKYISQLWKSRDLHEFLTFRKSQ